MQDHVECGICYDILLKPVGYALSHDSFRSVANFMSSLLSIVGCGHTFCEFCLFGWYETTLRKYKVEFDPDYDASTAAPHIPERLIARLPEDCQEFFTSISNKNHPTYTCPTCRQEVKTKPSLSMVTNQMLALISETTNKGNAHRDERQRLRSLKTTNDWGKFFQELVN